MNSKIQKTISDIEKTRAKITDLQAHLQKLEAQRTDLENTEIVSLFRSVDVAPRQLADFIRAYKAQMSAKTLPTQPAYHGQAAREDLDHED